MDNVKKVLLKKAIQDQLRVVMEKLEKTKKKFEKDDVNIKKEDIDHRDALRNQVEGLNKLFDEVDQQKESDIEWEYCLISTEEENCFIVIYFDKKNESVPFCQSHPNRDDALNALKDELERVYGNKVKEQVDQK